jgi:dUTP pyrophosphatase
MMQIHRIEFKKLDERAKLTRGSKDSAAVDLHAMIDEPLTLYPGQIFKLSTGIAMFIKNRSLMGQLAIRSSWGARGISLANGVGIIDADYQGEILATLINLSNEIVTIQPDARVVQLMIAPALTSLSYFTEVESFSQETERGEGGFGSTGE